MTKPQTSQTFDVFCYGYPDDRLCQICVCETFEDARYYWFRWIDVNRVALCKVCLEDGTLLFQSDVTQKSCDTFEGERIKELWFANPDDYGHTADFETVIVRMPDVHAPVDEP